MSHDSRIAASLICGDQPSDESLQRLFHSLKDIGIAEIFLSYNGTARKVSEFETLSPIPVTCEKTIWEDDFATARNHSLSLIPRDEFTHWFWADSDDTIHGEEGEDLHTVIESLDPRVQGVFLRYDYGHDAESGVCIVQQWRERLFSTKSRWKWVFPIHELVQAEPFSFLSRRSQVWVKHHRVVGTERDNETRARNRRILMKAKDMYEEGTKERSRIEFYLANEVYAEAEREIDPERKEMHYRSAILAYEKYVQSTPDEDDVYVANHRMADCYRAIGNYPKAVELELTGVAIRPSWSDSWIGASRSFFEAGDIARAGEFADIALKVTSTPTTTQPLEPLDANFVPLVLRGMSRQHQGNLEDALADFEEAADYWCPQDHIDRIEEVQRMLREREAAEDGVDTAATPSSNGSMPPSRSLSTRSIAFFTKPLFEPWNPDIEKQGGMGGAETCVMRLAKLYADDGWDVGVYGTPGEFEGRVVDGVHWLKSQDFDPRDGFDVVVGSRAPELFDTTIDAGQTLLWLHDVHAGDELRPGAGMFGDRIENIGGIVTLSPWHQKHIERLYGLPSTVVPNGIDLDLYRKEPKVREGQRFVYASSPDRGLDVILAMWPEIRNLYPEATLDVFYGWTAIDVIISNQPDSQLGRGLKRFKDYVMELLDNLGGEESGITLRGRISQEKLSKEFYKATHLTNPTFFAETFGIVYMEAQAAGCIPVTSQLGALETTVACRDLKVSGWPNNFSYRESYLALLEEVVDAPREEKERWIATGRDFAMTHGWTQVFTDYWIPLTTPTKKKQLALV